MKRFLILAAILLALTACKKRDIPDHNVYKTGEVVYMKLTGQRGMVTSVPDCCNDGYHVRFDRGSGITAEETCKDFELTRLSPEVPPVQAPAQ